MNIKIMTYEDLLEEKKMLAEENAILAYEVQRLRVREKNLEEANRIRDKDNETLKAEIMRLNKHILEIEYNNTVKQELDLEEFKAVLKNVEQNSRKAIESMAEWISNQDIDKSICKKSTCRVGYITHEEGKKFCIECIINHFKGEVKE